MQQQKHSRQARQALTRGPALLILLGAAALLAMLMVAGWGSARAAPRSGGPSIIIVSINGNTLNLQFSGWTLNQTVTLNYSPNADCSASQPLPNAAFSITTNPFNATYTWPSSGIAPGTYYLCASGLEGTTASPQTITVASNGTVQSTPGAPGTTPTATAPSSTPTTTTSSPVPSATTRSSTTGTPGNGGQGASSPPSNTDGSTLVAIILLCLLVLALLAYLIRIWLQGRQPSASPPGGGGQQKP